jgi:hypothetical protein
MRSLYTDRESVSPGYMLMAQGEKVHSDSSGGAKENLSWMITEPLGAVVGGAILGTAGAWSAMLVPRKMDDVEHLYAMLIRMGIGYTVGSAMGIWLTGKYVEKEEGSFLATMAAGSLPVILAWVVFEDRFPGYAFAVSTGCGLIAYRLTLK